MSLNHQLALNVFVVVFVFLLVETCLLILLINCQIGHMCPMTLMTLKDDSLSETLSPIQLPWTVYIYGIDQLDYFQVKRRGSNRNREEWLPLSGFITRFA